MERDVICVKKEDSIKDSLSKISSMDLGVKFITPMNTKGSLRMVLSMGLENTVRRMVQTHMSMKGSSDMGC